MWNDDNNRDGLRPENLTVDMKQTVNGTTETLRQVTLDAANGWEQTFDDLPAFDQEGRAIAYSFEEPALPTGYTGKKATESGATTFTNTHEIERVGLTLTKTWSDDSDRDGMRPKADEFTGLLHLLADGVEVTGATPTLSGDGTNTWTVTWANLPKYRAKASAGDAAAEIVYKVHEDAITGYNLHHGAEQSQTVAASGTDALSAAITNSHVPETTTFAVAKLWRVAPGSESLQMTGPQTAAKLLLYKRVGDGAGSAVDAAPELNGDETHFIWRDLPKYEGGKLITYYVTEDPVAGFAAPAYSDKDGNALEGYATDGGAITNSQLVKVRVYKSWADEGTHPDVTMTLLADSRAVEGQADALLREGAWSHTWEELPYANKDGGAIAYSVREAPVAGYAVGAMATYYDAPTQTYEVYVNNKPQGGITVEKHWSDGNARHAGETLTVRLSANGTDTGDSVTLDADNGWKAAFEKKYDALDAAGKAIKYAVREDPVPSGYRASYVLGNADAGNGFTLAEGDVTVTVTNALIPKPPTPTDDGNVTVRLTKIWDDDGDRDGLRPDRVTLRVYADGTPTGYTVTLTRNDAAAADRWTRALALPRRSAGGERINYSVVEENVPEGYAASYGTDGRTVTNTHVPGKASLQVTKTWTGDRDDRFGTRPDSVVVRLLANGEDTGKSVTLSEANHWTGSFTGLDARNGDGDIAYTLREDAVNGYACAIIAVEGGFVIENRLLTKDVEIVKYWHDAEDTEHTAAELAGLLGLTVDGADATGALAALAPSVTGSGKTFRAEWNDLPAYGADDREVAYGVREATPAGYDARYSGGDAAADGGWIINTRRVSLTVEKRWDDGDDRDGKRPGEARVELLRDSEASGETAALSAGNRWTYTWTGLPYADAHGKPNAYGVRELDVPEGYAAQVEPAAGMGPDGFDGTAAYALVLVNSTELETEGFSVSKVWYDQADALGRRPERLTFLITADGAPLSGEHLSDGALLRDGKGRATPLAEILAADGSVTVDTDSLPIRLEGLYRYAGGTPAADAVEALLVSDASGDSLIIGQDGEYAVEVDADAVFTWVKADAEATERTPIAYAVREGDAGGDYAAEWQGDAASGFVVTNTLKAARASLKVEKAVVSAPANGAAYRAGETMRYRITLVNDGDCDTRVDCGTHADGDRKAHGDAEAHGPQRPRRAQRRTQRRKPRDDGRPHGDAHPDARAYPQVHRDGPAGRCGIPRPGFRRTHRGGA